MPVITIADAQMALELPRDLAFSQSSSLMAVCAPSDKGMGFLLSSAAAQFSASQSFAAIAGLLVVALVVDWFVSLIMARALRWKSGTDGT
jgi:ABC-type nitrate/sulfonate/bicarbonate transport system permease component